LNRGFRVGTGLPLTLRSQASAVAELTGGDRKAEICENGRLPGGDVIFGHYFRECLDLRLNEHER
jgi:hypothetical protein